MSALKRKLSNPFNMNGNNSNQLTTAAISESEQQLVGLLLSPGGVDEKSTRPRKNSAPGSMASTTEKRSARTPRFNIGGGKKTDSPTTPKKKKGQPSFADKKPSLDRVDVKELKKWEASFSTLLESADGIELFEDFLKSEFSDENIQFWKACERFKTLPDHKLEKEAEAIFQEYIAPRAPKPLNIDYQITQEVNERMKNPDRETFSKVQQAIYLLMARDSFVRFVKAEPFQLALKR